ncbi:MAG: glycosyltransferase family 2 protein [Bacteroidia bacterium]|nr:glycosyltransferase family 2 protein [Bacteroidia bacterium]
MQLSVIIVNYNVKYFLEECLLSVLKAQKGLDIEIIVVDNHSTDGSVEMLKEKFGKDITLIANEDNPGFSKANNQGIRIAKGKYVLLLNPDTIVGEDTFKVCLDFMDSHPEAGGLGVKMLDGKGKFLPESKRALPTPWVSFYKIFGFSALFPKNKRFAKYHLTYLDKNETHEIEILSGAFMWMRKSVLEEVGYLDETFFMYGEDIDLSYRIILGGYKNYYLSDTQIIHYKGESTKKGSLNYVKVFYQAMIIFAKKHFQGSYQTLFIMMIQLAVYLRALGAVGFRVFQKLGFALLEGILFYLSIFYIKEYWEKNIKYIEGGYYPPQFDWVAAPVYTVVFLLFLILAGAYKRPFRIRPLITAMFSAFIAIATVSYIFPKINYSRAIVGLSSVCSLLISITTRGLINLKEKRNFFFTEAVLKRVAIVAERENLEKITGFLHKESDYPVEIAGFVSESGNDEWLNTVECLGKRQQLPEIIRIMDIQEVIFCQKSIENKTMIYWMEKLSALGIEFKTMPPDGDFLIGSQFIQVAASIRKIISPLSQSKILMQKRIFDGIGGFALLILFPFTFWAYRKPVEALKSLFAILTGKNHCVGYIHPSSPSLPPLRPGALSMLHRNALAGSLNPDILDHYYAQNFTWDMDLEILLKGWRYIGTVENPER